MNTVLRAVENSGGELEEIGENGFAFLGEDGLGVELDAPDGKLPVANAHDFAFGFGFGSDLEGVGECVALDKKRVITGGGERIGKADEKVATIVINLRCFAVHEAFGTDDFAAENMAHALMPEANTKRGDGRPKHLDDLVGEAGFAGRTGAW